MTTVDNVKAVADTWAPDDVIITAGLFSSIISLLEELDIEDYPCETIQLYGYVLHSLNQIKGVFDLKAAFTRFFYSEDGYCRFSSHMNSELMEEDSLPF